MSVERERLTKVTNEAELRVGMLVALKGCNYCQKSHCGLVLARAKKPVLIADNEGHSCLAWDVTNTCRAKRATCAWKCLHGAIDEGRLFIVDVGLESDTPAEAKRPAPRRLERTR